MSGPSRRARLAVMLVVGVGSVLWAGAPSMARPATVGVGGSGSAGLAVSRAAPLGLQDAAGPFTGTIGISADGLGVQLSNRGLIHAEIPLEGSTVVQALLYVKTH